MEILKYELGLVTVKAAGMERGDVEFGLNFTTFVQVGGSLDTTETVRISSNSSP